MSDYSDKLRDTLEEIQGLVEDDLADAGRIAREALSEQNPNAIEVEIRQSGDQGAYEVRCHGADSIITIGPVPSLADAFDSLSRWAARQAQSQDVSNALCGRSALVSLRKLFARQGNAGGCTLPGCPFERPHYHVDDMDGDRVIEFGTPEYLIFHAARQQIEENQAQ